RNVQLALDARLEVSHLIGRGRMLQVIKRAAVGNGRDQGAQLQWGHGNAFAKRAHSAYSAVLGGNHMVGILAQLLSGDVVTRQLTQAELVGVIGHLLKSQLASYRFEISIVGVGQSLRQVEAGAAAQANAGVLVNYPFTERRQ